MRHPFLRPLTALGLATLATLPASTTAPLAAQTLVLRHDGGAAVTGVSTQLSVLLDHNGPGPGVNGWTVGVCFDPTALAVDSSLEVVPGVDAAIAGGGAPAFHGVTVFADGWLVGTVLGLPLPMALPISTQMEIERVEYRVIASPGASTRIEFCDGLGAPPLDNLIVIGTTGFIPITVDGIVDVVAAPASFRRGDANADGAISIGDVIVLLSFLFQNGAPLLCADAGDTDDDGSLALNDSILFLNYLILGGAPPAPPGPIDCGIDPTFTDVLPVCVDPSCP